MSNASRAVTAVFGVLAGLAGLEHGIGEMLQGSVRPESLMILSWPESSFFRILGGEPAMTVIPDLFVSGAFTVLLSLALMVWASCFAQRHHGGLVLLLLSVALLLVGGGFGPPFLGAILALAALRAGSPHPWAARSARLGRLLAAAWPWALAGGLFAWLLLMPGIPLLAYVLAVDSATLVVVTIACAFAMLTLSIFTGFARDARSVIFRQSAACAPAKE